MQEYNEENPFSYNLTNGKTALDYALKGGNADIIKTLEMTNNLTEFYGPSHLEYDNYPNYPELRCDTCTGGNRHEKELADPKP